MKTVIINAHVISPDVDIRNATIVLEGKKIKSVKAGAAKGVKADQNTTVVDVKGQYVMPGFIDVHLHGACGYDVCDATPEAIEKIAEALTPVIKAAVEIVRKIWDAIARRLVPKKWWHLYKHAKKRRIRKKYEKRIRERVLAILSEGEA